MRIGLRQPATARLEGDDDKQHQELGIDARLTQDAANPTVKAEVNERREGPDLFFAGEAAEHAGYQAQSQVEGERQVFVMVDGGQRQDSAAQHGPAGANQQAEENYRFKGNVGGQEVGDGSANPDA